MHSITYTTDGGTEIEVREIDSAVVADVVQSAALLVDSIEGAIEADIALEGKVFVSPLRGGGVLSILFPTPAEAVGIENIDTAAEGAEGTETGQSVPEGYYVCEHCGNLHPVEPLRFA